ncbi:hypothetical protein [Chitinimonas sp.]|uniref:hypothetical protein n=1 Tax=Chitinimonas sp. TaxID=1934313 RepID=UPI002F95247A
MFRSLILLALLALSGCASLASAIAQRRAEVADSFERQDVLRDFSVYLASSNCDPKKSVAEMVLLGNKVDYDRARGMVCDFYNEFLPGMREQTGASNLVSIDYQAYGPEYSFADLEKSGLPAYRVILIPDGRPRIVDRNTGHVESSASSELKAQIIRVKDDKLVWSRKYQVVPDNPSYMGFRGATYQIVKQVQLDLADLSAPVSQCKMLQNSGVNVEFCQRTAQMVHVSAGATEKAAIPYLGSDAYELYASGKGSIKGRCESVSLAEGKGTVRCSATLEKASVGQVEFP